MDYQKTLRNSKIIIMREMIYAPLDNYILKAVTNYTQKILRLDFRGFILSVNWKNSRG